MICRLAIFAVLVWAPSPAVADTPDAEVSAATPPALRIHRATAAISVDGVLADPGWQDVAVIDTWYETTPGDNVEPKVRTRGRITYNGDSLYIGLEFDDPNPRAIRAPFADRDNVSRETDYGGVILDPNNTGRTGVLFLVNPRNVQYDSISEDGAEEDASPDFFWDSATKLTSTGWTLEIRIPFSSLSYARRDPQPFRIMLYRNYPREFRYQMFTTMRPRDVSCFICRANPLLGLTGLPAGGSIVVAPYVSGALVGAPVGDLGSEIEYDDPEGAVGVDAKWRPTAGTVVDVTVNPDFSQIESDVPQISANERFALQYPEKRPFFLEGVELLTTPITALYTRTLTDPQWGARGTVKLDRLSFMALVVQDEGGGQVIVPGPRESELAAQDFRSWVGIARMRYDVGAAFFGALGTTREVEGGGYNRVGGLDFQWRPGESDSVVGQYLHSFTRTPKLLDLSDQWDGRWLKGHGALVRWQHTSSHVDFALAYRDIDSDFRADNGYVPQVGIRQGTAEAGYTIRPDRGVLRRLRGYATYDRIVEPDLFLLSQTVNVGTSLDALLGSTLQAAYAFDQIRVGDRLLSRNQLLYNLSVNPGAILARIDLAGSVGQEIDFANARRAHGFDIGLGMLVRPDPHLELQLNEGLRIINVDVPGQSETRLFTARIDRLRAIYAFTARLFLRLTVQHETTVRSPSLYLEPVAAKDAAFAGSLLLAYKINWQSVAFVGYGDSRTYSEMTGNIEPDARQFFIKLSRAFQW